MATKNRLETWLDLRAIIGAFFICVGLILLGAFLLGPSDLVEGIHLNLVVGSAMLLFGVPMLVAGKRAVR